MTVAFVVLTLIGGGRREKYFSRYQDLWQYNKIRILPPHKISRKYTKKKPIKTVKFLITCPLTSLLSEMFTSVIVTTIYKIALFLIRRIIEFVDICKSLQNRRISTSY